MSFVGAIDDSGNKGHNLEFLSILIGEEQKVYSIVNTLPSDFVHLTDYQYPEKMAILRNINLSGNIKVICMRFGYEQLISAYNARLTEKQNKKSDQKLYNSLGVTMKNHLHVFFKDFLIKNHLNITDIHFEEDHSDIRKTLLHGGLKCKDAGLIHKVADCIAHANFKNWRIKGVIEYNKMEFKTQFRESFMQRAFRRG